MRADTTDTQWLALKMLLGRDGESAALQPISLALSKACSTQIANGYRTTVIRN